MTYICQTCKKQHDGSFGTGRFCSNLCAKQSTLAYGVIPNIKLQDGTWLCSKCQQVFSSRNKLQAHKRQMHPVATYQQKIKKFTKQQLVQHYEQTLSKHKTRRHFNLSIAQWNAYIKQNNIHQYSVGQITSKNIQRHPQRFYWNKKQDKFISAPCQFLKNLLTDKGIKFYPQYKNYVQFKHNYAIDIAFPNQKLAIQVNGTQHYSKAGLLKPYYQERHDILVRAGWRVLQIPYSKVYNADVQQQILQTIMKNVDYTFDYQSQIKQYFQAKEREKLCQLCGSNKKTRKSTLCRQCASHLARTKKLLIQDNTKQDKQIERRYKRKIKEQNEVQRDVPKKKLLSIQSCPVCGKEYIKKRKAQKYCSPSCALAPKKLRKLTVQQLQQLVKTKSLSEIGRMFDVSANAIKKHCKKYNIDHKQYQKQIKSKNMRRVMTLKYRDHINPKQICTICGKKKKTTFGTLCRQCYRQTASQRHWRS